MARKMSTMDQEDIPLSKRAAKVAKSKAWKTAVGYKKSGSCMFFTSVVTLTSCIFFVVGTYLSKEYETLVVTVEAVFAFVFFVDYVLSITAEAMWLSYILSFEGIVDLLSIFPVFGGIYRWLYSLSFVRYLRLGKVTRTARNHRMLDKIGLLSDVTVNACLLGLKITGLILMTTAIIYGTEQAARNGDIDPDGDSEGAFADGETMQWHDSLYFTIVTLSTVGYGDILPITAFSRMLMVIVILFALTYVPLEVGNLLDIVASRPKNRAGFSRHLIGSKLHVILAMVPGSDVNDEDAGFNPRSLRRVIDELCHEDHGMDNESLWVVVMAPCPPSLEVLSVIRSPRFMSRVVYYRGSVMDPMDMAAVCAEYADCIFLYPCDQPPSGGLTANNNHVATEEKTTLAAKSVQRYLDRTPTDPALMGRVSDKSVMGVPCRTLVTVMELSSKEQLLRFGINHVICHDELKMSMLACATLFPAFLPFAINAMRSSSDYTTVNNTGEVKHSHNPSGDPGGIAAAAASAVDQRLHATPDDGSGGSGSGGGSSGDAWLRDYKSGTDYEVYSLALTVPEESCLWGMTFGRAAEVLYSESDGEVLLLAVVEDLRNVFERDTRKGERVGHRRRHSASEVLLASSSSVSGGALGDSVRGPAVHGYEEWEGDKPTPADQAAVHFNLDHSEPTGWRGGDGERGERARPPGTPVQRRRTAEEWAEWAAGDGSPAASFVHATIFPAGDFVFVGECNVLVLAEDKRKAERFMIRLQKSSDVPVSSKEDHEEDESQPTGGGSVQQEEKGAAKAGGKENKQEQRQQDANTLSIAAAAVVLDSASTGDPLPFCGSNPGPLSARSSHALSAVPSPAAGASSPTAAVAATPASPSGGAAGEAAAEAGAQAQVQAEEKDEDDSVIAPSSPPASPAEQVAESASEGGDGGEKERKQRSRRLKKNSSSMAVTQEEEQAEQMEAVREEMRTEDGVRWKEVLLALTEATGKLNSLKSRWGAFSETRIMDDPKVFFSKVQDARSRLDDALRVQAAAVPEGLSDHLVVIGKHPRLQYYVVAMRRQRPNVAIVVVTSDKETFFELREKVAEAKCEDPALNITRIFSVCGNNHQRSTFEKARVGEAAAVVVVSDAPNDSDVLLVSFELEQVLSEIPPGHHAPKVLIDLHTDNSIYYCGNTLGRGSGSNSLARSGDSGRLKEISGLSTAGVWEWPLFAAGMVWTESIMEVFAVQTYFSTEFLAFFETLLQIRRPVLVGNDLVEDVTFSGVETQERSSSGSGAGGPGSGGGNAAPAAAAGSGAEGKGEETTRSSSAAAAAAAAAAGGSASSTTVPPTGQFDMLRVISRKFRGKRYDMLARELIQRGAMPLGLYRPAGTKGSSLPYTQVNPSVSERLVDGDVVFVLRSRSCSLVGFV